MSAPDDRDPRTGRFQKGQSGNRRGRPKNAKTVSAAVMDALSEKVPVNENGRRRRVTKLQATATQVANRGAQGDPRAIKLAMDLAQKAEERMARHPSTQELSAADEEIVGRMIERLRRVLAEENPDGSREIQ
jgi:hypothetical protein